MKKQISNLTNKVINVVLGLWTLITLWFVAQILLFATFKIPSNSMAPELTMGDYILVWKPAIGPRLFDLFASMRNEQTQIYRVPGYKKIKRNDILVFNFPYPRSADKIEMHILKYYIKRCVGLPGDTLSIRNGFYHIGGISTPLGNMDSQRKIAATKIFQKETFQSFPFDSILAWNIKDFGPLYVPGKGDSITLNHTNFKLYRKQIEWEQQGNLQYKESTAFLNGNPINGYRFQKNYYFMAGDNGLDSQDSRYWGLLPEEYIVGKAWIIWKSYDPFTGKFRWERFLKVIH